MSDSDRTMFARCSECNRTGLGTKAPMFFSMAYTRKQWAREPECDNCHTKMQLVHEVKVDV